MTTQEFFLQFMDKGLEFAKIVVPALVALHLPQPKYMRKKQINERQCKSDSNEC